MKAITIKEPFASLIVNGYKDYEFRSWKTKYRGKVLIHSAKSPDKSRMKDFESYNLDYSCGEIIGEAYIYDCVEVTPEFKSELVKQNYEVYKNASGYAFCLKDIVKYKKRIPYKGALSFWEYSE